MSFEEAKNKRLIIKIETGENSHIKVQKVRRIAWHFLTQSKKVGKES